MEVGMHKDPVAHFLSHVDIPSDPDACWEWRSSGASGYGIIGGKKFGLKQQYVGAHRLSYMLFKGVIPEGLCIRHTCDHRKCVNPDHLITGTLADNNADRKARGRNADRRGHKNTMSELSTADVVMIRSILESGRTLSRRFGVSEATISVVRRGQTWSHLGNAQKKTGNSYKVFFDGHAPKEEALKMAAAYESGINIAEVAEIFGTYPVTIRNALKKLGVKTREAGLPKKAITVNGTTYPSLAAARRGEKLGTLKIMQLAELSHPDKE